MLILTSEGVEKHLNVFLQFSFDSISENSLNNIITGYQYKFISQNKILTSTLNLIERLPMSNNFEQSFLSLSENNLNNNLITEILTEKNISFGIINEIEKKDLDLLFERSQIKKFNEALLKQVLNQYGSY